MCRHGRCTSVAVHCMKQTPGIVSHKSLPWHHHPRHLVSHTNASRATQSVATYAVASGDMYGGRCHKCNGTWHSMKSDVTATHAARQLLLLLDHYKRFDYQVPTHEAQACFSTDYVWIKGPGRMLGVLVAQHPVTHEEVVLKAFSGQLTERWICPGWVGPVAGITADSQTYMEARSQIEGLSHQLRQLEADMSKLSPTASVSESTVSPDGSQGILGKKEAKRARHRLQRQAAQELWPEWAKQQHALLTGQRKSLSHRLIEKVQASYLTRDLAGRHVSVLDAYYSYTGTKSTSNTSSAASHNSKFQGFPAGTGDCCLPKLLHAAQQQGLKPLSCVEFWYGSAPSSNTPQGIAAAARRKAAHNTGKQNPAAVPAYHQTLQASAVHTAGGLTGMHTALRHSKDIQGTVWYRVSKQHVMDGSCSLLFDDKADMLIHGDVHMREHLDAYDWTIASRVHGLVYGACDKCQTILGALLCDVI